MAHPELARSLTAVEDYYYVRNMNSNAEHPDKVILVHGAWHGGWCWQRVVDHLEKTGSHRTRTPTLQGLGSRRDELTPDVGLHTHVEDVVELLEREDLSDVVLVGHSYAGFVVREAADRVPARVRGIVMLDAWAGHNGESLATRAPAWFMDAMRTAAETSGDGWAMPALPAELLGVSDPDDIAWLAEMCTPHPLLTFTETTTLTGAVESIPHAAIVGHEAGIPFRSWAEEFGWPVDPIDCGHDAMIIDPGAVAKLISAAATTFDRR
jgi:pimeloyl-ACP methyl ester carboxylesterase